MTTPTSTAPVPANPMPPPAGAGSGVTPARYWNWLSKVDPKRQVLAWCHSTDAFVLRDIMQTGNFVPQTCPVFGEDLLYFFYGRPAYRSTEENAIGCAAREPVVLIMAPTLADRGVRLYPFDSGAFQAGRYDKWMHKKMSLKSFELPPNLRAPERHVTAFFDSNEAYLSALAIRPTPMPAGELEVDCLANFLTEPVNSPADDRRCAVELLIGESIAVDETSIYAIIMPFPLTDADYVKDFAARHKNIEIMTYSSNTMKKANEFQALLEERVTGIYQRRGML